MGFTVLIADDEPLALSIISSLIEDDSELEVVSVCKNGDEAAAAIHRHGPDIAFLDVEMPGMSGLEVADRCRGEDGPKTILMSSSEKFACRCFELQALDYLVKPVRRERLIESVSRAKKILQQDKAYRISSRIASLVSELSEEKAEVQQEPDTCLVTRSGERLNWLKLSDIVWVEASNQYLTLHTEIDDFIISKSLSGFLEEHRNSKLCRVHRSHAVNLEAVQEVHRRSSGRTEVRLKNGRSLAISRSRQSVVPLLLKSAYDYKKRQAS